MTNADFPFSDAAGFWQEPDIILSELVSLIANRMNAEVGLTLMIGGAVLTGTLIGEREYLSMVSELFKLITLDMLDEPTQEDRDAIAEAFDFNQLAEDDYLDDEDDQPADAVPAPAADVPTQTPPAEREPLLPIRFLHLKNPVVITPGSTMEFRDSSLPAMRIRLSQIDGWMVGRVSQLSADYDPYDGDDEPRSFGRNRFIQ